MIKFREQDFIKEVTEMTKASFYRRNKVYFWVSSIVSVFALLCSAWFSESFWTNVVGSQVLGLVITFMVSLIVYYVGGKVVKDYLQAGGFGVPVLLLLLLGGVNLYTDLHGVSYISKGSIERPTNEQTLSLDETFAANRKNYERRLNEQNAIIKENANWLKYSATNGRWTKHKRFVDAQKEKAAVEKSLDALIKAHTTQRETSQQLYVASVDEYNSEVDFLTEKYRYFASGCFVLFLGCLGVRVWFLGGVLYENTLTERTNNGHIANEQPNYTPPTERKKNERKTDFNVIALKPVKQTNADEKKNLFFQLMQSGQGEQMSVREIQRYCGLGSTSTVSKWKKEWFQIKEAM